MNKDTWVGIFGSLILVAAMVGVFLYERAAALETDGSTTDGGPLEVAGPTLSETVALGETETVYALVEAAEAGNLTFTLTWTARTGTDTLQLSVAPPTGSGIHEGAMSEEEDDGEITLTVPVPEGASPMGQWEVKVTFLRAQPDPLPGGMPPPSPVPSQTDASVDFTVATTLR